MRKLIYATLLLSMCACGNNLEKIGEDFIGSGSSIELLEYRINDTYTIKIDSFATSTGSNIASISELYVGKSDDPLYGGLTVVTPTFQIAPLFAPVIDQEATLDSVTFHFSYSGHLWGDTISNRAQTLSLCELAELPVYDEEKDFSIFYNTKPIPPIKQTLATTYFYPTNTSLKQAYFKLPDSDGYFSQLFNRMKYKDDLFSDLPWNFINLFHGIALVPSENNDVIFGFAAKTDSLYLTFHYHKGETMENIFNYPLSTPILQYYNATNTPTSTLSSLKTQRDQVAIANAGFALIQGISGYMVKINLPVPPPQDAYSTIVKAELELNPLIDYNANIALPSQIYVYKSNDDNEILSQLSQGTSMVIGTLDIDYENMDASRYRIDLTAYYETLSSYPDDGDSANKNTQLIIKVPSMSSSFDRLVIEDTPILRLYYAHYNNK